MHGENSAAVITKIYQFVPPDGGWAYMIWIATVINYTVTTAFLPCTGMIFNEFYIKLGMGTIDIQLLHGIHSLSVAISSFLTGPMMKVMSMRKLSFLSSTLLNAGVFCMIFVNSRAMLMICQGLLQSIGVGMLYNVTCTSMNDYFLEKRFLMTSLAHAIAATASMAVPFMLHWTSEVYGYRGTLILVSAVSLQAFIGSTLMQPVKWHMKKVCVTPETIELLEGNYNDHIKEEQQVPESKQTKLEFSNNTSECIDDVYIKVGTQKSNKVLVCIKSFLDWPFLKKFILTCTCVGTPLSLNSDVMFSLFLPQALYALDWKKDEVVWALSLLGFGDMATRILLILASTWLRKLGNHLIYIIGMTIDVLAKLVLLWTSNTTIAYVALILTGCSRCILIVVFPLVLSESVPPEKYAMGFGVCILFYGVIGITLGPAIGALRDATENYTVMFYVLNAIMAVVAIAWSIELFHKRKQKYALQNTMRHD